jgi:tRNA 2-thiouridine synthesizing protein A
MAEHELDVRGLICPLPVLKARKALQALAAGDSLRVLATDPKAVQDFAAFAEATGVELLESREDAGTFVFVLRKPE